jgi:hypothetical protein
MKEERDNKEWEAIAKEILDNEPSERVDERDDLNLIGGLTMPKKNTNKLNKL